MAASTTALMEGLREPLAAIGVDLEDVQVQRAGRRDVVRVVIDRDGGVDLDLVAQASHLIAERLDDGALAEQFPGAYVLEVTSPGVDRPLTEPKHWRRALRRLVAATLADGSTLTGRVVAADDQTITLELANDEMRDLPLTDVVRGEVQVEFNRVDDEPEA